PISVSPTATSLSFVALLPPLAIFLGTLLLNHRERRWLSLCIVGFGVFSAFLGLLQMAQGPTSSLRFFTITNVSEPVGFFANKDHFAALLYVVLLFTLVWAIDVGFRIGSWRGQRIFEGNSIFIVLASSLAIIVILATEAIARSRAGMTLTIVCLVGIYALIFTDRRRAFNPIPTNILLFAIGAAFILAIQFALYRILQTLSYNPL